jgi:hypothetical protein
MDQPPSAQSSDIENITSYLRIEWLENRKIAAFVLSELPNTNLRASIDTWIEQLDRVYHAWPVDQPFLIINDMATVQPSLIANPYLKGRLQTFSEQHMGDGKLKALGIILSRNTMTHLTRLMARPDQNELHQNYFFGREDAVRWLLGLFAPPLE